MAVSRIVLFSLLAVLTVNSVRSEDDNQVNEKQPYRRMHRHYDYDLGDKDGLVSYDEIKRALGRTNEEEWIKEIEQHDDGDKKLNAAEFENWLTSFTKKQEL